MIKHLYYFYLIARGNLFDRRYYHLSYPETRKVDIEPIMHYIKIGWKEGKNPSKEFDTNFYLESNTDVKNLGINPLIHYILFGKAENRAPVPAPKDIRDEKFKSIHNINQLSYLQANIDAPGIVQPETEPINILNHNDLSGLFALHKHYARYTMAFSHDNYLSSIGGVQILISREQNKKNNDDIGYVHLYPHINYSSLVHDKKPFYFGLSINGTHLGTISDHELIIYLSKDKEIEIQNVVFHHTMGMNIHAIANLLNIINIQQAEFWLHDFFTLCPNYFLLRNMIEPCNAPDLFSNACQICYYGEDRRKNNQEFMRLFRQVEMSIISPSDFAKEYWGERTNLPHKTISVRNLVELNWQEKGKSINRRKKLRVAFVGFPAFHKGWDAFQELTNRISNNSNYEFYLFSSIFKAGNFKTVPVTVTTYNKSNMTELLRMYEIDIAFLWSLCPETLSLTLHESLAAGCYIITNAQSGNIHLYIAKNPEKGMIINDVEELIELFEKKTITNIVKRFRKSHQFAEINYLF